MLPAQIWQIFFALRSHHLNLPANASHGLARYRPWRAPAARPARQARRRVAQPSKPRVPSHRRHSGWARDGGARPGKSRYNHAGGRSKDQTSRQPPPVSALCIHVDTGGKALHTRCGPSGRHGAGRPLSFPRGSRAGEETTTGNGPQHPEENISRTRNWAIRPGRVPLLAPLG